MTKLAVACTAALFLGVGVACGKTSDRSPSADCDGCARPETTRASPSGRFHARVRVVSDTAEHWLVSILDTNGHEVFSSTTKLYTKHTTFILWNEKEDVLWIYSGDIGTAFVTSDGTAWREQSYAHSTRSVQPPQELIRLRPHVATIEISR